MSWEPIADVPVPPCLANVLGTVWFCGCDHKRRFAAATRNGFGQFRIQCGSKVRLIIFKIDRLEFLGELKLTDLIACVEALTEHNVREMFDNSAGYEMKLDAFDACWIPPGSIVFEETLEGSLNYYIRQSFLPMSDASHKTYLPCVKACKLDNKPGVEHMESVLGFIRSYIMNKPAPVAAVPAATPED